jgi:hypothetical protein
MRGIKNVILIRARRKPRLFFLGEVLIRVGRH